MYATCGPVRHCLWPRESGSEHCFNSSLVYICFIRGCHNFAIGMLSQSSVRSTNNKRIYFATSPQLIVLFIDPLSSGLLEIVTVRLFPCVIFVFHVIYKIWAYLLQTRLCLFAVPMFLPLLCSLEMYAIFSIFLGRFLHLYIFQTSVLIIEPFMKNDVSPNLSFSEIKKTFPKSESEKN
jgi:hypothetical protein